jgi:hypothetical protein
MKPINGPGLDGTVGNFDSNFGNFEKEGNDDDGRAGAPLPLKANFPLI